MQSVRLFLLLPVLFQSAISGLVTWNLTCFNGRTTETCTYGQFCSNDYVQKGCRNCTDPHFLESWSVAGRREDFREKYPMCDVFLERRLWQTETQGLLAKLDTRESQKIALNDTVTRFEDQLRQRDIVVLVLLALCVILAVCLIVAVIALCRCRHLYSIVRRQTGSAGIRMSDWCCTCRKKTRTAQPRTEEGDVLATSIHLLTETDVRTTPTAPFQVTDSGHPSETGSLASSQRS